MEDETRGWGVGEAVGMFPSHYLPAPDTPRAKRSKFSRSSAPFDRKLAPFNRASQAEADMTRTKHGEDSALGLPQTSLGAQHCICTVENELLQ
jgi:hypothetical protein